MPINAFVIRSRLRAKPHAAHRFVRSRAGPATRRRCRCSFVHWEKAPQRSRFGAVLAHGLRAVHWSKRRSRDLLIRAGGGLARRVSRRSTVSGAMTPAGLHSSCAIPLSERGLIDVVVTTDATPPRRAGGGLT